MRLMLLLVRLRVKGLHTAAGPGPGPGPAWAELLKLELEIQLEVLHLRIQVEVLNLSLACSGCTQAGHRDQHHDRGDAAMIKSPGAGGPTRLGGQAGPGASHWQADTGTGSVRLRVGSELEPRALPRALAPSQ